MGFAREVGTDMVFIDGGVIVEEGPPRDLFANPSSDRLQKFFAEIL
jgi:polar amino acid transport system ATP-binding protein